MKKLADQKKKENIAEYILYMYRMEDLIRAYGFNLDEIKQFVVAHFPVSEEEKWELTDWLGQLATQMKIEGIKESGHLSSVQKYVKELAEIHWGLLQSDKLYFNLYKEVKPIILEFIISAEEKELGNEIQICLNGLYGLLLCRLTGKKVPDDLLKAATVFGKLVSYLNWVYMDKQRSP